MIISRFFWSVTFVHSIFHGEFCESPEEWERIAAEELRRALKLKPNLSKAKNVILFVGDGMGISTLTSGRIYKGQLQGKRGEEGTLAFERFPYVALAKTYNDNLQTPDSAGTATAFFSGQKASSGVLGVDSAVREGDCASSKGHSTTSVLEWAQDAGKGTGVVTTTRITHATPAATYAHAASRNWESDSDVPVADRDACIDIAKQLIEDLPGRKINVIFGGGRLKFIPSNETDLLSGKKGLRLPGENLFDKWKNQKAVDGFADTSHQIMTRAGLYATPLESSHVLGLFSGDHLEYELKRNHTASCQPSLSEMTAKAVELLQKHEDGFFLMVEGGRIDHAHHDGFAKLALHDLVEFDKAIEATMTRVNLEETLIIVTADHSHTLSISGYAGRGTPILKFGGKDTKGLPYTTLSYANGPGALKKGRRKNLTNVDTEDENFRQEATVDLNLESHGGEDVAIYAQGPYAHLFHTLHEQHYIAHVIDYAACLRKKSGAHCLAAEPEGT